MPDALSFAVAFLRESYGKRCSFCEVPVQVFELAQAEGHTYKGQKMFAV